MRVRLVADDLTGALDAAVRLVPLAGELPVVWDAAALRGGASFAFVTNTRDSAPDEAARALTRLDAFWRSDALAFKKIDSLWRGNTLPELVALIGRRIFPTAIVACAFPEQHRVTRGGQQYWRRAGDRAWQPAAQDLRAGLARHGIDVKLAAAGALPKAGFSGVWMFDAETSADLDAVVASGRNAAGPVLWCGAAGLAGALGGRERTPPATLLEMPATLIVGSNHVVSRDQVAMVKQQDLADVLEFGLDERAWGSVIAKARSSARSVALWFSPGAEVDAQRADAAMTAFFERLTAAFQPPGALIVTGGETLFRLCRATQATRLFPGREIAPGIAASRIADGRWDGQSLISKSGAFGASDFLATMLRKGSI